METEFVEGDYEDDDDDVEDFYGAGDSDDDSSDDSSDGDGSGGSKRVEMEYEDETDIVKDGGLEIGGRGVGDDW
ncbi:hypothetical protein SARC_13289 [Sphaeroforma arctica JP610]|uniref:Uncharacterized protein n=1 Tax=Sphaeroforma arctica JP610 TaxID=667725 RepID=A0A0L0FCI0_9EUKA|nr:hypothetical protein SARC_13289 [Sphaeroforma arctica JP610]KNC74156.1 hypothetical protein SARC_13289 [Sphaeroforma arctica JP610]|eukprot:XP_014148058.1 hypothetical protein SARC_13289 [Sphaeroforma arctica JP610]